MAEALANQVPGMAVLALTEILPRRLQGTKEDAGHSAYPTAAERKEVVHGGKTRPCSAAILTETCLACLWIIPLFC